MDPSERSVEGPDLSRDELTTLVQRIVARGDISKAEINRIGSEIRCGNPAAPEVQVMLVESQDPVHRRHALAGVRRLEAQNTEIGFRMVEDPDATVLMALADSLGEWMVTDPTANTIEVLRRLLDCRPVLEGHHWPLETLWGRCHEALGQRRTEALVLDNTVVQAVVDVFNEHLGDPRSQEEHVHIITSLIHLVWPLQNLDQATKDKIRTLADQSSGPSIRDAAILAVEAWDDLPVLMQAWKHRWDCLPVARAQIVDLALDLGLFGEKKSFSAREGDPALGGITPMLSEPIEENRRWVEQSLCHHMHRVRTVRYICAGWTIQSVGDKGDMLVSFEPAHDG